MKYDPQITYQKIQDRCKEINLKIKELNAKCGISKDTLSKAAKSEEGMKAANLFSIAECLGCSVDYLLGKTKIISVAGDIDLTANEQRLLAIYRKLSPDDRLIWIGKIEQYADDHAEIEYQKEEA